jgi:GntR family transcriptional regulator
MTVSGTEEQTSKYGRITAALRDEARQEPTGTRLAPERVLAERFGVSRMTVRQALDILEGEGWIERAVGNGTFVRRPVVTLGPQVTSFTEDMAVRGLQPGTRLLGFDVVEALPHVAEALDVHPGDEVLWLERLRLADGDPMCVEVSHLPLRYQALLEAADLEASLHSTLRAGGAEVSSLLRRVGARAAPRRVARLLGLPDESPVLELVDIFADDNDRPMQYAASLYRPDRYAVITQVDRISRPAHVDRVPEERP